MSCALRSPRRRDALLGLLLCTGIIVPAVDAAPAPMGAKIAGVLKEDFPFDPGAKPAATPADDPEVVTMAPVRVTEKPLPRALGLGIARERTKLTPTFNLQDGGELLRDAFGRMTIEAKPHRDLIGTSIGTENPMPRWTLLRIKM